MSGHTPGKWKAISQCAGFDNPQHATQSSLVLWIGTDNGHPVCAVVAVDNDEAEKTYRANIRLITAAPDLLDACKAFVAYDAADDEDSVAFMLAYADALAAAKAAILKATGA